MNLLKHILFLLLVIAFAITPRTMSHEVEALEQTVVATCPTNFGDLFSQLDDAKSNLNVDEIRKAFCGHFTVDLDHSVDTSSTEMMHSTSLYFAQFNLSADTVLIAETLFLPAELQPHSLHPEVAPHPPKK